MIETLVVAAIAGAVGSLLVAIRGRDRSLELFSKAAASAGFVGLGLLRWSPSDGVDRWLVIGLALCAVGDLFLLGRRGFLAGIAAFLAGHLAYLVAFSLAVPWESWSTPVLALVACAGGWSLWWLLPRTGRLRIPVTAYIVAISAMVWGALSASLSGCLTWTVGAGGILFLLSDLAVARHRFVKEEFLNRGIGLPLYYAAQILIALGI
jgi:uncharacterized membrane protein YhhN